MMHILFFVSVSGMIAVMPLYFWSLEHHKLEKKHGKKSGTRLGELYSYVSGWGFFLFWFGIWISPQPRFTLPVFENLAVSIPLISFSVPVLHIAVFVPFFTAGAWFGIEGVRQTGLKTAETHRTDRIVNKKVYSIVRHPQYFGGFLAHLGISFLLSAWYSLLVTPLLVVLIYVISRKEEEELINEFGAEYEEYRKLVPMFIPRLKKRNDGT
jgi:protein-S-isoprenylcysteine O-methyltransferase Ste14